jgi:hypothetical protein
MICVNLQFYRLHRDDYNQLEVIQLLDAKTLRITSRSQNNTRILLLRDFTQS